MMKRIKFLFILIIILSTQATSFAKEKLDSLTHSTFEIYVTKYDIRYSFNIDYNKINLDTIQLSDKPFLTSDEIEAYDTSNHVITLNVPKDSLDFPLMPPPYGRMFIVLVNKKPQYCGFFWFIGSSVPCNWIVILSHNLFNGLTENQIQISLGRPINPNYNGPDPRSSNEILKDLEQNGLLTNIYNIKSFPYAVYPNPTSQGVTVKGINKNEKYCISVYNEIGELVEIQELDAESTYIDLNRLLPGVYFLRIKSYKPVKIIKQ